MRSPTPQRVQFKNSLSDSPWQTLGSDILATNTTAFKIDSSTAPERFYRILLVN